MLFWSRYKSRGTRILVDFWDTAMSQISGLWWWEDLTAVPASRHRIITAIVVLVGFLLSMALIGGMARSKIGLADEGDLPQYVGTRGRVAFSQIPRLLFEQTEVGQFGQGQRFRTASAGPGISGAGARGPQAADSVLVRRRPATALEP